MAQLPVYNSQKKITSETPGNIRELDTYTQGSQMMSSTGARLQELSLQWQNSKDEVENLDARNKLQAEMTSILDEANNYNDYSSPAELQAKQDELTRRMSELTPNIIGGFSNNQKAREFESNANLAVQQNNIRLQGIFREKYGDMYNSNLQISADEAIKGYTLTGNEAYKQNYFDAIDTGVKAGYLDHSQATALKLKTDDWNYDYVYSKLLENPYFKASDDVMAKISPTKQRTLQNLQKSQIRTAKADALNSALNDFYVNPTQDNLSVIYKLNPKLKESKKLEELLNTPADMEVETNFDGYAGAMEAIKELASIDTSSYNGKLDYAEQAGNIALKILKLNVSKDGTATISNKDKDKLFDFMYKQMGKNPTFDLKQIQNLPDLKPLKDFEISRKITDYQYENWNKTDRETFLLQDAKNKQDLIDWRTKDSFWNTLGIQKKLDDIKKQTAKEVLLYSIAGNYKEAKEVYNKGLQEAIRTKYWYIPELQNENLQAGTKFTVNGKVYTFQGYSSKDMIVEVN